MNIHLMIRFKISLLVAALPILLSAGGSAIAQQLEPLLDLSEFDQPNQEASPPSSQPIVLTGSVRTLDAAIREEADVDWYGWYLAVRNYFQRRGGLQCEIGTPIKFFRSGHIQAESYSPSCLRSVMGKHFPLPGNSRLSAVVLPVRSGKSPPASKEELYHYIRGD